MIKHLTLTLLLASAVSPSHAKETESQVILIGENHLLEDHKKQEIEILTDLRKEADPVDCLFLEAGENFNPALAKFSARQSSYADSVGAEIGRTQQILGLPIHNNWPEYLLVHARNLGMKLFAVDMDYSTRYAFEFFQRRDEYRFIVERNGWMAFNISRLLESGQCKRGVLLVGSLHVEPWKGDAERSIPGLLRRANITTQVIKLPEPVARKNPKAPAASAVEL